MKPRSLPNVATSRRRGTPAISTGPSARSADAMMGSTAFFAPETRTDPWSLLPPRMWNVSSAFPLFASCPARHPVAPREVLDDPVEGQETRREPPDGFSLGLAD